MNTNIKNIKQKILPVLKQYDVSRAALFGSYARGENETESDLDLLVEFKGEKSLLDLAGLKIALEELLGMKVDVLTYNSLHHLLKEKILKEQKILL
jgi:predicted nucleotidyltransferase